MLYSEIFWIIEIILMEIMIREITFDDIDDCTELFINVFNSEPWNDEWTLAKAIDLFKDFFNTPGFIGFKGIQNNKTIAVCIGHVKKWRKSSEYYIEEYFISPELQHKGFGTDFLKKIEEQLVLGAIRKITLLTARNTPAEKFYKKNNFINLDFMTLMKKDL